MVEAIEADTHYVRKFVRRTIDLEDEGSLDRALRPLLPLRPAAEFDLADPLDVLGRELREASLPEDLAARALDAFRRGEEVAVT